MAAENVRKLRALFEAVCELPARQWRSGLEQISDDPALIEEALALLEAQTISFNRALKPLGELVATWSSAEFQPGDRLGAWQLVERLGSGGMGTVFVAERADELFRQRVAIKLLRGGLNDPLIARHLAIERQVLAELQHPHIARLYDGGTTPSGQPYLVMEYVSGRPLDEYCAEQRLELRARLLLFLRICRAVQAAHQRLVVHCDLKPSNILVRDSGEPVLLDFGIAQVAGVELAEATREHENFCTPAYASPEQLGGAHVSVASDVFSLGVLLTEVLAAGTVGRTIADRYRPVPAPSALASEDCRWRRRLRGELDAIAGKACALQPEQRYPSVGELMRDIERYFDKLVVSACASTPGYRFRRWLHRHWREVSAGVVIVVITAGFVWRLLEERERARQEAATAQRVSDFLVAAFDAADPRMRGRRAAIEPSARDVLDLGAAKLETELSGSPAILARMRAVLGRAYKNMGLPQQAEPLLRQATHGFLDPAVGQPENAAQAQIELGVMLASHQYGEKAEVTARRALQLLGPEGDAQLRIEAYKLLGYSLILQGNLDGAEESYRISQQLTLASGTQPTLEEKVTAELQRADLYRRRGAIERSLAIYREALRASRAQGAESVLVQSSLHGTAMALFYHGRLREAREALEEHLRLSRLVYDDSSAVVGDAYMDLAAVLRDQGEYVRAEAMLEQARTIQRGVAGEHSREHTLVLEHLGNLAYERGDPGNAERLWLQSMELNLPPMPSGDRRRLRTEGLIAVSRACRGEDVRIDEIDRPQAVWAKHRRGELVGAVALQLNRAEWLVCRDQLDAAQAALAEVDLDQFDPHPGLVLYRHRVYATLAGRRGQWSQAVKHWREAIAVSAQEAGEASAATARWRIPYAQALVATGEAEHAQRQLRLAAVVLRRELPPGSIWLQRLESAEGTARTR